MNAKNALKNGNENNKEPDRSPAFFMPTAWEAILRIAGGRAPPASRQLGALARNGKERNEK